MNSVLSWLEKNNILYTLYNHPAVFTCEEANLHCGNIPGLSSKNLFLKSRKNQKYYLYILPSDVKADLKEFGKRILDPKMSFASEDRLWEVLQIRPGSVSLFGMLNDSQNQVSLYIHEDLFHTEWVSFHPNDNTATIALSQSSFRKVLSLLSQDIFIWKDAECVLYIPQ